VNKDLVIRLPSALVPLELPIFSNLGISIWIKREDLLHPRWGGNKYRKLKYNLKAYQTGAFKGLVTFGGLHSNHIYATAAVCKSLDIPTIGIIRGEEEHSSATINFAKSNGMQIKYVSRSMYRDPIACLIKLSLDTGYYILPEGGTNQQALNGTAQIAEELFQQMGFWPDAVVCPFGTGGTAAGILKGLKGNSNLKIFPALKGKWIEKELEKQIPLADLNNYELIQDYHFGGYGKYSHDLIEFIHDFYAKTNIPLDPIYTGKMMYGFLDWAKKNPPEGGSKFVIIHTGGIQGNLGFNQRFGTSLPVPDYILR